MTLNGEMGKLKCTACGHEFTPWGQAKFCPECGANVDADAKAAPAEDELEIELSEPRPVTRKKPEAPRAPEPAAPNIPEPEIPKTHIPEPRMPVDNRLDIGRFTPPAEAHDDAIDRLVEGALEGVEELLDDQGNLEVPRSHLSPRPAAPSHTDVSGNVVGGEQHISVDQQGGPGSTVKAGDNVSHGDQTIEVRSSGSATSDYNVTGGSQTMNLSSTPGGAAGPVKVSADGNVVHGDQTVHITQVFGAGSRFGLGGLLPVFPPQMKVGESSRMTFKVRNTGSVPIDALSCELSASMPEGWAELRVTGQAAGGLGPSAEALFEAMVTPLMTSAGYITFHWKASYLKDGISYEYPFDTHEPAQGVAIEPGALGAALTAEDWVRLEVLVRTRGGLRREALVFSETLTVGGEGKTFQKRENMLCLRHPVDAKYISSQAADVLFEAGSFRLKNFHRAALDGMELKKYKTKGLTGRHKLALGGGEGQPPVTAEVEALPNGLFPHLRVDCAGSSIDTCWLIPGDIGLNIGPGGLTASDSSLGAELRFRRMSELFIETGQGVETDGETRPGSIAPRVGMHFKTGAGEMEIAGLTRGRVEKTGFSPQGWGL